MQERALLAFADGSVFWGRSIGAKGLQCGELVFNTAMTGYQEILTDPSYARQIVTLTYPHIGNTGVNALDVESNTLHAAGLVVRDCPQTYSSWRANDSLTNYLFKNNVVAIAEVDTREITRRLRSLGNQNACLMAGDNLDKCHAIELARAHPSMQGQNIAAEISVKKALTWDGSCGWQGDSNSYPIAKNHQYHVVAIDFGIKHNILRWLSECGCKVTLMPAQSSAEEVLNLKPHGIFLSNGPGDPEPLQAAIAQIKIYIAKQIPIFGICLGNQLLALAAGAKTIKMKHGHHGANHPVQDLKDGSVLITSQNHGFAVAEDTLPANVRATHRSLFDGSLQGIEFTDAPIFAFQGHPEANPGPRECGLLFARFIDEMKKYSAII